VVPLGGWQLVQSAKEVKTGTIFSFHHTAKIAPGAQITVWSAGKYDILQINEKNSDFRCFKMYL